MIRKTVIEKIRKSRTCKAKLMLALDIAPSTLQTYLDNNDIMLTTIKALEVIRELMGVEENSEILEPQPV